MKQIQYDFTSSVISIFFGVTIMEHVTVTGNYPWQRAACCQSMVAIEVKDFCG